MSNNSQDPVAGIADRGVARHLCDAAALDPDRRQDPADQIALAQSFLACDALCHAARIDDVAGARRHADVPDRFRFHRPHAAHLDQRRRAAAICAGRTFGRQLLRRHDGGAWRTRHCRCHRRDAERIAGARCDFQRTPRTLPTIPMPSGASCRSSSTATASSSNSAPASSARRARCISSGAVSISR